MKKLTIAVSACVLVGCVAPPSSTAPTTTTFSEYSVEVVPSTDRAQRKIRMTFDGFPTKGVNGEVAPTDQFHTEGGSDRYHHPIAERNWVDGKAYEFTVKFESSVRFGFDIVSDRGIILDPKKARLPKDPRGNEWIGVGDWSGAGKNNGFLLEVLLP